MQKKKNENLNLELEKNIDILNYVSKHNSLRPKLVIGFAAETNEIEANAKKKLVEKNCDWVVANDVSNKSIGFDSDFNEVSIFYKDDEIKDEKLSLKQKSAISEEIVDRVDVPVTAKMRLGTGQGEFNAKEICQGLEQIGIQRLCVHGRTLKQRYSGVADWDYITSMQRITCTN